MKWVVFLDYLELSGPSIWKFPSWSCDMHSKVYTPIRVARILETFFFILTEKAVVMIISVSHVFEIKVYPPPKIKMARLLLRSMFS